MSRVYNFSAGPAVLPEEVLREAADEMLDYRGTGMSVMEVSHRSKTYQTIIDEAEADLRTLMGIPDNYKVLFMQGGASQQFAMIPMTVKRMASAICPMAQVRPAMIPTQACVTPLDSGWALANARPLRPRTVATMPMGMPMSGSSEKIPM